MRTSTGLLALCGSSLLLLQLACVSHHDALTTETTPGEGDDDETTVDLREIPPAVLAELIDETERIRHLQVLEPFEAIAVESDEVRAHVREQMARMNIAPAEQIMKAFGFLPADVELEPLLVQLLGDEVVGLYDPREDRLMVLRSIAMELGTNSPAALEARGVLIHEVVHALQDQHFSTLDRTSDDAWADDAHSVLDSLAEGDATLAMIVAAMEASGVGTAAIRRPEFDAVLRRLGDEALTGSETMAAAPPYFGHVLTSSYFDGAIFAAALFRRGGWSAIDEAHRNPPVATQQILHPEAYFEGRVPEEVSLPEALPGLEGYELVRSAVLGELETSAYLLPLDDRVLLREAAAGWVGDHFAVYRSPEGQLTLIWRLRFRSPAAAMVFLQAARDTAIASGRGPCVEESPGVHGCHGGADRLVARGREVALLRGGPAQHNVAIAEALLAASPPAPIPAADAGAVAPEGGGAEAEQPAAQ